MNKSRRLRELIVAKETLVMPDAYDAISARIIEYVGFDAVQCSGYSFSVADRLPQEIDVTFEENVDKTRRIVNAVNVPVMADGEDGFGDGDALKANIRKYIEIGAAGANIEDQNLRNEGQGKVIPESRMLEKIACVQEAAREAGNPEFVLNARTDALKATEDRATSQRLAIDRANKYLDAGATLCFIPYVQTREDLALFAKEVRGPISVTAGQPNNARAFSIADCCELGIARVSLPTLAIMAAIKAQLDAMKYVRETRKFDELVAKDKILSDMSVLKALLSP